jgi:hypothetical protein
MQMLSEFMVAPSIPGSIATGFMSLGVFWRRMFTKKTRTL